MSVAATEAEIKEATVAGHDTRMTGQTDAGADAPMVGLSDKAAEKVKEIRGEENIEEGYALRLKVQGGGCSGLLVRPLLRPAAGRRPPVRGQGRQAHLSTR